MLMLVLCLTSTTESPDEDSLLDECLLQIAGGDTHGMERLYRLTHVRLYGYVLSVVRNVADAQDILHDCYVSIWSGAAGYRSVGKPMAWIFTVAKNLCRMKFREQRHTADGATEEPLPEPLFREEVSPEDRLVLNACLQTLSEDERRMVVWHTVSGLKHREIAHMLDLPLPTVLSKYHRALKKLKTALLKGEELP